MYVGKSTKASNQARGNACRLVDVVINLVEVSRLSFVKFFDIVFHENWFISYRFVIDEHRQNRFNGRSVVMSMCLKMEQN